MDDRHSGKTVIIRENRPYIDLAGAILWQAKEDYLFALRVEWWHEAEELEQFFLSRYGQMLSFNQGEYIIDRCRVTVAREKRQRRIDRL